MSEPRVLLVDDEPSMRWTMAEFLRRGGYEPLAAADFDGALALAGEGELDAAFARMEAAGAGAMLVSGSPLFTSHRRKLVELAARHALPSIYDLREYAEAGGLLSYAASLAVAYRQAGVYAGRILKGEKPADLPVQNATQIELVVNLNTAKALGLTVPPTLLARADEVIE